MCVMLNSLSKHFIHTQTHTYVRQRDTQKNDEEDDNNNARHAKQVCKINHIITSDLFTWLTLMTENGLFVCSGLKECVKFIF